MTNNYLGYVILVQTLELVDHKGLTSISIYRNRPYFKKEIAEEKARKLEATGLYRTKVVEIGIDRSKMVCGNPRKG